MKKYIFTVTFFVLTTIEAQTNKPEYERVYVEAGFVKPLGRLSEKFDISTSFGFWFRNRVLSDNYIDFGFNFFIPNNPSNVNFKYQDSVLSYKSRHFAINIGARFAKVMPLSLQDKSFNFEWNSGVGLALNAYKAPDEIDFGDDHSGEILTTFYISQGIKVNYKNVGLQCHYQWSPYGLFAEKLEKDFGSQSIMFGIVYRQ